MRSAIHGAPSFGECKDRTPVTGKLRKLRGIFQRTERDIIRRNGSRASWARPMTDAARKSSRVWYASHAAMQVTNWRATNLESFPGEMSHAP